jgi:hypothetical protein
VQDLRVVEHVGGCAADGMGGLLEWVVAAFRYGCSSE